MNSVTVGQLSWKLDTVEVKTLKMTLKIDTK